MVEIHAADTEDIDEARAGDICAFVSMKETETGDSLSDMDHPALLERMRFPDPVISVAVEPKSRADVDKMSTALYKMVKADPSLRLEVDQETGQTLLRGMGELHLEVTIDRMRTELGVEANMGRPRVSFREAFGRTVEHTYTHKKQTGGSGQYARVIIDIEPTGGCVFRNLLQRHIRERETRCSKHEAAEEGQADATRHLQQRVEIRDRIEPAEPAGQTGPAAAAKHGEGIEHDRVTHEVKHRVDFLGFGDML